MTAKAKPAKPKDERPPVSVRTRWGAASIEAAMPYSLKALMSAYRLAPRGAPEYYVEIPLAPPSVNKMYRKNFKNGQLFLDPKVRDFRDVMKIACKGVTFDPRGIAAAVVMIEDDWVSQKYTVRRKDIDNPVKCVLDALGHAIGFRDELLWEVHQAKLFSRRCATHVWLFDLGDIVTATGGLNAG